MCTKSYRDLLTQLQWFINRSSFSIFLNRFSSFLFQKKWIHSFSEILLPERLEQNYCFSEKNRERKNLITWDFEIKYFYILTLKLRLSIVENLLQLINFFTNLFSFEIDMWWLGLSFEVFGAGKGDRKKIVYQTFSNIYYFRE